MSSLLAAAHYWVTLGSLTLATFAMTSLLTHSRLVQLSDHLYLDNFLDSVESLPQELQRNFMLMRQLDTRTQELMAKIERNTRDVLRRRENLTEQRTDDLVKKIRDDQKECLSFSDEKISLVRRLDSELEKFESELREKDANESNRGGNKNKRQKTDKDDGKLMFSGRSWIGQRLKRYWDEEAEWFEAVVTDYKPDQGGHKLTYDIGTELESFEWYDLDRPIEGHTQCCLSVVRVRTLMLSIGSLMGGCRRSGLDSFPSLYNLTIQANQFN